MKPVFLMFFCGLFLSAPAQESKSNKIIAKYAFFLENGFEKVDLIKVPSVDRSFFSLGTPMLVIYKKSDLGKKNLVNSYTVLIQPFDQNAKPLKAQTNGSPVFNENCRRVIMAQKAESQIKFIDVKLNVTDPDFVSSNPAIRLPAGTIPFGFFLYLK